MAIALPVLLHYGRLLFGRKTAILSPGQWGGFEQGD
jgi:hypothetical protein